MTTVAIETLLQLIETPLGPFQACWTEQGLYSFEFVRGRSKPSQFSSTQELPAGASKLEQAVQDYFETGDFSWDLRQLDWQGVSAFQQKVLRHCYRIKPACTMTYGELADKVGSPGAARAVGGAMAKNRWPLLIPCHRVVGSNGKMTGYSGVGGIDTKQKLLALESELTG